MTDKQIVAQTQFGIAEPQELGAHRWTSSLLPEATIMMRDPQESPHSIWGSLIMVSGKKGNNVRSVFKWIGSMVVPVGVVPCFDLHNLQISLGF